MTKRREHVPYFEVLPDHTPNPSNYSSILPTPAAAPTDLAQRDKSFVTAALAFIPDNQTETFYVGKVDSDGDCRLTRDPKLALRFRWDREAKPRPRILECWVCTETLP